MKNRPNILALLLVLTTTAVVHADLLPFFRSGPNPRFAFPPEVRSAPAQLVIQAGAQPGIRIVLSAHLIKALQATDPNRSRASLPARSVPFATVVFGLSLSLALASLLMVKSRRRLQFTAMVCLAGTTAFIGLGCPDKQIVDSSNAAPGSLHEEMGSLANLGEPTSRHTVVGRVDVDGPSTVQVAIDKEIMMSVIRRGDVDLASNP